MLLRGFRGMSENLIIKLDWNKETTPPPSITDLKNFVSAFEMLFAEKQYKTEVEVREGSIDLVIQCIDMGVTVVSDIILPILISAINRPRSKTEKAASNQLSEIHNYYNCTINNHAVYPQSQPSDLVMSGVEYRVVTHDLDEIIKTHYNEDNNPVNKKRSEKIEAWIEITSGEFNGKRYTVKTPPQFTDRDVTYIASFSLKNDKLKMIDKPMTITQR